MGAVSVHLQRRGKRHHCQGCSPTAATAALFYGGVGFAQLAPSCWPITVDVRCGRDVPIFKIIDKTIGLRVPEVEYRWPGYPRARPDFCLLKLLHLRCQRRCHGAQRTPITGEDDASKASAVQMNAAVLCGQAVIEPAVIHDGIHDTGMHKVSIIAKLSKLDRLKTAERLVTMNDQVRDGLASRSSHENTAACLWTAPCCPRSCRGHRFHQRGRCGG